MPSPHSFPASWPFDLAVIGGGIAGSAIAREASLHGKRVILFEKNTFGSGTSSKSSKLIHGGLRYLEVAWSSLLAFQISDFRKNLRFVFLALRETHRLAKEWPQLIHEIELLMPIYKGYGRNKYSVFFGTWLYGLLSKMSGGKKGTQILNSANAVLQLEPALNPNGLWGGVIVQDHTTDDLALVTTIIRDAIHHGTQAFEQAQVIRYHFDSTAQQFKIDVLIDGRAQTFFAKHLVNASGAWVDQVRQTAGSKKGTLIVPVAGAHIEVKKFSNYSTILQAKDKRLFFIILRGEQARIGTTERIENNPDKVQATADEIEYLLKSIRKFFPDVHLTSAEIISTDAGIRPLAKPTRAVSANQISREHAFVFDKNGAVHVLGVKLTDHHRAAKELIKKLFSQSK